MHDSTLLSWCSKQKNKLCLHLTADFTAICRPGYFKHDSLSMTHLSWFFYKHKAMKEISRSFAFLWLFVSQEVAVSSVSSFHVQNSRIMLLLWVNNERQINQQNMIQPLWFPNHHKMMMKICIQQNYTVEILTSQGRDDLNELEDLLIPSTTLWLWVNIIARESCLKNQGLHAAAMREAIMKICFVVNCIQKHT